MRVYHFTEQPYPDAWSDHAASLRVTMPNRQLDPVIAADLLNRYYDEWALADELGLDVMVNEHHQTATCMSSTSIVALSVLARITKRARILYSIPHRPSHGLRCALPKNSRWLTWSAGAPGYGLYQGVPYEFACSNQNAVGVMDSSGRRTTSSSRR